MVGTAKKSHVGSSETSARTGRVASGVLPCTLQPLLKRVRFGASEAHRESSVRPNDDWQANFSNQIANFRCYCRAAFGMPAFPRPVQCEALSMPSDHSFWLHEERHRSPITPEPGKSNPENAIPGPYPEAAIGVFPLENDELMTQGSDLGLQCETSSKAAAQRTEQGTNHGEHGLRRLSVGASQVQAIQSVRDS